MLEFKLVLLLLAAATYPKITLKENSNSTKPIQNKEFQTAQTRSWNYKESTSNVRSNISGTFISKLNTIKNACISNTISRFQEIILSTQNQAHQTKDAVDKVVIKLEKIECKPHCVYVRWFRVKCVSSIFNS